MIDVKESKWFQFTLQLGGQTMQFGKMADNRVEAAKLIIADLQEITKQLSEVVNEKSATKAN